MLSSTLDFPCLFPSKLCDWFVLFSFENWQVMASYTVNEVIDMLWNESGDEEDISHNEFDENDEAYVGESESSDHYYPCFEKYNTVYY